MPFGFVCKRNVIQIRLIRKVIVHKFIRRIEIWTILPYHGGSARDIFRGSGFIHKEYIMSPLISIINFRHFHSYLASYSKIPTLYFYFERFLPGPMDTLDPGRNHSKQNAMKIHKFILCNTLIMG